VKKLIPIFSLIAIVLFGGFPAVAADTLEVDTSKIMRDLQPASSGRGILFKENMEALFPIGYISYTNSIRNKPDKSPIPPEEIDWKLCSSWSDSKCLSSPKLGLEAYIVLGSCINETEIGCVEYLKAFDSNGVEKKLTLVGPAFKGVNDIPQSDELGIPRSSSRPIYEDERGSLYLVRASLHVSFAAESSSKPVFSFSADVTPVLKIANPAIERPEAVELPNNSTGKGVVTVRPTREECLAIDVGICYAALRADTDSQFSLSVRVPTGVNGWLNGRFSEPKISMAQKNVKSQVITVTAKPAKMPVAGGWANYSEFPDKFFDSVLNFGFYKRDPQISQSIVVSPSQGDNGFKIYALWEPYLKDKALTTLITWSFATAMNSGVQFCSTSQNEISGIVASNASVYSSRPPDWDASTSTLSYQVASPHYDENGKENVGTYTLAMSLNAIRCLYGQSSLPPSATVSVGYGAEVVTVATITLKSDSNWVYFAANGFHYSSPTIKVKFAGSTKPAASGNIAPTAPGAKIQWCAKGNAKKKVMAVNPVCPKGYKKIKAPL
jgi:hypothetical protein